jgi:hypothetical protein
MIGGFWDLGLRIFICIGIENKELKKKVSFIYIRERI